MNTRTNSDKRVLFCRKKGRINVRLRKLQIATEHALISQDGFEWALQAEDFCILPSS